jgi:hypothetical protein
MGWEGRGADKKRVDATATLLGAKSACNCRECSYHCRVMMDTQKDLIAPQ